ncbi:hypothetical protein V5799_003346 [Amblyomma americanum]|uniref:Lipocalin n=1 Tax=Amblyomma americanum TaxID=6943 RepID=A0AAQ4D982_AMBAM
MNAASPLYALSPFFIAFVFSFPQSGTASGWREPEDLFKFVNTTEKIWVYNSSELSNVLCKVDVMDHINKAKDDYYFNRTIYTTDGRNSSHIFGALFFRQNARWTPRYVDMLQCLLFFNSVAVVFKTP